MTDEEVIEAVTQWFEREFPCRHYENENAELKHLEFELGKWIEQKYPDWKVRSGSKKFITLFGWECDTDLELRNQKRSSVIPIEVKLTKEGTEYGTLHAMGQAIYYSRKAGHALALVVDQGRAARERTHDERKLQDDLWNKLRVRLSVRKA
ncbi:MAG: hypothetical protein ACE5HL_00435 [Terriglobia bacterium]